MALHSPMLRAMFTSDMQEVAKQEIRLDDICKDIIQIITFAREIMKVRGEK